MQLSKTEIKVLEQIARGNKAVKSIAKSIAKSVKQVYVTAKRLEEIGIVVRVKRKLEVKKTTHLMLLMQTLAERPNLAPMLADAGIPICMTMLNLITVKAVIKETGFKKATIYKKLEQAKRRSLVIKKGSAFKINEKFWPMLKTFLEALKKYEAAGDDRIPISSIIYYKRNDEIVFSTREEVDAAKTAFSAYEEYGIKPLLITEFYYLPKRKLSKKEIFLHSLYIAEKTGDLREAIFVAMFYIKYYEELKKIKHLLLEKITKVLKGERIRWFPSLEEIKEKAEVYGIKV
ncbi:MAG: hypothetical protein Q8L34_04890 [Candidatus Woesearchaeota archaeon]|nr:hypothetical protein [Candidatus Woesearchaeota archaeon]